MTDKEFIQFSKKYFGDLDYKQLSEAEYKNLYEQKEAERIISMANGGKLDDIFDKLTLKVEDMKVSLMYNGKTISSTILAYTDPSEARLV